MSAGRQRTALVVEIGGRAGRWACKSLHESGFRVVGTYNSIKSAHDAGGPYCDMLRPLASPRDDGGAFADGVCAIVDEVHADVIMQTDNEAATEVLTHVHARTSAAVVGPDERQYKALCDKSTLDETARAAGLDTPLTVLLDADGPIGDLPAFPCIVKPAGAITGDEWRHLQRTASVVHDPSDRDRRVAELVRAAGAALVQEQVVGRAWRVHFVATRDAIATLPVITRYSYPRDAGMSSVQQLPKAAPDRIFDDAELLIRSTGYVGPGSVQFIERDDRFFVHDVNLRLPSSVAISIKGGLDMPTLAARVALGDENVLANVRLRRGITYVWLGGEVRALLREVREPRRAPRALATFASVVGSAALGPASVLDRAPFRHRLRRALTRS